MQQYKGNLSTLNGRYGEVERRLLLFFAEHPKTNYIDQPGGLQLQFSYLIRDGLLECAGISPGAAQISGRNTSERYLLTAGGREFIERWVQAQALE
jgi:hypothetical protein